MITSLRKIKEWLFINLLPELYKKRHFKFLSTLNWTNIHSKNLENELLLVPYLLEKDSIFIDVGANLGSYVYKAEEIIPPENIYAFEPHPYLYNRLKKIFKRSNISQCAISDSNKVAQFKIPFFKDKEVHTRGTLKTKFKEIEETSSRLIAVQITTLDNFTQEEQLNNISLIKIDVEGAEIEVIKGAKNVIKNQQPVLIIEMEQRYHDTPITEFIKNIEYAGNYICYYFDAENQMMKSDVHDQNISEIQSEADHGKSRSYINNFIFIPKNKVDKGLITYIHEQISH